MPASVPAQSLKIAVKVTVEMTPEQLESYCSLNGIRRSEVRRDVRDYIRTALQESGDFGDGQADVTVAG
jgi:hypothetical protein